MDPVPTRYIERDGAVLAYQVVGDGPADVVHLFEIFQHLDLQLTDPDMNHNYERVARFSRAAYVQRRGVGLSEQVPYVPTMEQQADDVLAVMDAVGMQSATLVGWSTTCGVAALVAAAAPERVSALILIHPMAQGPALPSELNGWTDTQKRASVEGFRNAVDNWGSGALVELLPPAANTPFNRRLMAMLERSSATPAVVRANVEAVLQQDMRDVLRAIQCPTRVLCIPDAPATPQAAVRFAAELIPNCAFHLLPSYPPGTSIGRIALPITDHVEEVVTGAPHSPDSDRFLGTVLFTDVVGSTELLERVGDSTYRRLRAEHESSVRLAVETSGGRLMTVTGDGTLSVFESPTRAVRCAERICREAEDLGITVRAGLHTGELEQDAMNVTGLSVHIGARVGSAAGPGEVLVSRTVRDLAAGSDLAFETRGVCELKGVSGTWELFAVVRAGGQPADLPKEASMQTPMDKIILQAVRKTPSLARAAVRVGNAVERRRARRR